VYLVEQQHLPLGRVQQLLSDLWRMRLWRGTLVGWIQHAAQILEPVEQQFKDALVHAPVLHHDETGVRRAGKLAWAHVTSTSRLTHCAIHAKRGREALEAIGVLPTYQGVYPGVSVHDGWGSYAIYTACRHTLCNVHHLRELKIQQKVSGCFRSDRGANAYATIRGYLVTLRKQGQSLLIALGAVFTGQPHYPASA
jgi:transposase